MNWLVKSAKGFVKLLIILNIYFSFYNDWMCFHFCCSSLVGIPVGIASFAIAWKICAKTTGVKKYKSIIDKKKKEDDKIVLLAKSKLNRLEVLISKALIDVLIKYYFPKLNISHDELLLVHNVLKEYNKMKKKNKNLKELIKFRIFRKQCYCIAWNVEKIKKVKTTNKNTFKKNSFIKYSFVLELLTS